MPVTTLVALAASLLAPVGAFVVAKRQFSGRVITSDAKSLWEESTRIREWSTRKVKELEDTIHELSDRLRIVEHTNSELETENKKLSSDMRSISRELVDSYLGRTSFRTDP